MIETLTQLISDDDRLRALAESVEALEFAAELERAGVDLETLLAAIQGVVDREEGGARSEKREEERSRCDLPPVLRFDPAEMGERKRRILAERDEEMMMATTPDDRERYFTFDPEGKEAASV